MEICETKGVRESFFGGSFYVWAYLFKGSIVIHMLPVEL